MPDYFSHFPKIYYDAVGNGNPKLVTNLLRRVQMKAGLKEIAAVFDMYEIGGEDSPESVAEQVYGDDSYYWVILIFNNIKDRFYDWPLTTHQLETYINDKYADPNGAHHYEIAQTSGATTSIDDSHIIQVPSTTAGATTITNSEYERQLQHKKGRIRLIKPEFLDLITDEFKTLIGG